MKKRVVITGMGLLSPLGSIVGRAFERLQVLKNCVEYSLWLDEYKRLKTRLSAPVQGFEVPGNFDRKVMRSMGRVSLLAAACSQQAVEDAGLSADILSCGQTGVAYGSSLGSLEGGYLELVRAYIEKDTGCISANSFPKAMAHTTAANISLLFGTTGRLIPATAACASGSTAVGLAYEAIKTGAQTVMIAGGAEEMPVSVIAIFDNMFSASVKNLTPELTPAPFDKNRDGLVVGEGAGTLILEDYEHARKRGARIYAEILGFGTNTDGTHITNPNRATQKISVELALKDAGISAEQVDYVNAHGTGTIAGDISESYAVWDVFRRQVPVSSIKSYTGHTLGACGAIEAILTIEMMRNGWFCPTLNLNEIDPECAPLDYIRSAGREIPAKIVMSNNFAFGGVNTSLIFGV